MNENYESLPTGFENLLTGRARMTHWNLLSRLAAFGHNREACAIVESFQQQLASEKATSSRTLHTAA